MFPKQLQLKLAIALYIDRDLSPINLEYYSSLKSMESNSPIKFITLFIIFYILQAKKESTCPIWIKL